VRAFIVVRIRNAEDSGQCGVLKSMIRKRRSGSERDYTKLASPSQWIAGIASGFGVAFDLPVSITNVEPR
jgi:hypothetical protein